MPASIRPVPASGRCGWPEDDRVGAAAERVEAAVAALAAMANRCEIGGQTSGPCDVMA